MNPPTSNQQVLACLRLEADEASPLLALKHDGASAIADSRARTRALHLQFTSSRDACIAWRHSHPQTVLMGSEVDTACADSIKIGPVLVSRDGAAA